MVDNEISFIWGKMDKVIKPSLSWLVMKRNFEQISFFLSIFLSSFLSFFFFSLSFFLSLFFSFFMKLILFTHPINKIKKCENPFYVNNFTKRKNKAVYTSRSRVRVGRSGEKAKRDQRRDRRTDGQTDRVGCRVACTRLKIVGVP